jgi:hypothetical protein
MLTARVSGRSSAIPGKAKASAPPGLDASGHHAPKPRKKPTSARGIKTAHATRHVREETGT